MLFSIEYRAITKKRKHHGAVTAIFIYVVRNLSANKVVYIRVYLSHNQAQTFVMYLSYHKMKHISVGYLYYRGQAVA